MDGEGCAVAFLMFCCSAAAVFFGYMAITSITDWWWSLKSAGIAAGVIAGLFLLWWLLGTAKATGLDLARKALGKLEEEERGRQRWRLW